PQGLRAIGRGLPRKPPRAVLDADPPSALREDESGCPDSADDVPPSVPTTGDRQGSPTGQCSRARERSSCHLHNADTGKNRARPVDEVSITWFRYAARVTLLLMQKRSVQRGRPAGTR